MSAVTVLTPTTPAGNGSDEVECLYQENNVARTFGIIIAGCGILENLFVLVAIIGHWSKFLSNLYRFVASLVCADLLVAMFGLAMQVLKYYDTNLTLMAFVKGGYVSSHTISTISVTLVNASVFFTYSRFTTMIWEQQQENLDDSMKKATKLRKYFRKPALAYACILFIWGIALLLMILSMITRCTVEGGQCVETCATAVKRRNSEVQDVCLSPHCNKFLAPLAAYFTLSAILIFWISFVFLVASTITVVCIKVEVKVVSKNTATDNNGFEDDDSKVAHKQESPHAKSPVISMAVENDIANVTALDTWQETNIGDNRERSTSIHYAIKKRAGFNRDLMSRFAMLITIIQVIFWMPVTGMIIYTLGSDKAYTSFTNYEITQIYFGLPTVVNPWICVLTMSKLRDAIFNTYFSICH